MANDGTSPLEELIATTRSWAREGGTSDSAAFAKSTAPVLRATAEANTEPTGDAGQTDEKPHEPCATLATIRGNGNGAEEENTVKP